MRVLVTGASGFIGSAVVAELLRNGHRVVGVARSDAAAARVEAAGAEVVRASLEEPEGLASAAAQVDGVIHTAFDHDFSKPRDEAAKKDTAAIEAVGRALEGTEKPLVIASGLLGLSQGRAALETDTVPAERSARARSEEVMIALASRGVRTSILRLPPTVHGAGDHGFVPFLIQIARQQGASAYVGEGANRWSAVHRLDAARLFRLALEKAPPGTRLHAIHDGGVPTREIATLIGKRLGVPVVSKTAAEAPAHFGFLALFFGTMDALASSALTRERFGWTPSEPGLLADLDGTHYFASGIA